MIKAIFSYIIVRIPNISEFFYSICFYATISTIFERYVNKLGKDATSKFVIQDSTTAVSVSLLKYTQAEVGSTGDRYDEGSEVSIISRVICKTVIIKAAITKYNDTEQLEKEMSSSSKFSNYPCEIISRIPVIASMEMQRAKIDYKNYVEYFSAAQPRMKISWISESVGSGVIKILVANQVEEVINYINYSEGIKSYSQKLDDFMVSLIISESNSNYTLDGDIWNKTSTVHAITGNHPAAYLVDVLMFANSVLSNVVVGTINHYLFSPLTKSARDISESYIKNNGFFQFSIAASTIVGCGALAKYVAYPIIVNGLDDYGANILGTELFQANEI